MVRRRNGRARVGGRAVSSADALGHTSTFAYDAAGNQTEHTPGNSSAGTNCLTAATGSTYTTYNSWGLPESTVVPAAPATSRPPASHSSTTTVT